jgi:ABC-2 type transport system ATP-binding protein
VTLSEVSVTESADAAGTPVDPIIRVDGLTKRYGELTALHPVQFEVRRGEVFGILGPNGAGKTTLVEMLEGLVTPSGGSASVLGFDIGQDLDELKQRIGVQLQASSYHRYLTLLEILELFGSFYRHSVDPMELLERVRLQDWTSSRIGHLSGGMAQRFSIVAALVNEPEIVFFDEPTAGLDPDARRDLWELVLDVRARGATVVLTTHYMEEAETLCDRVAFLNAGEIVAMDTPRALVRTLHAPYRVELVTSEALDVSAVAAFEGTRDVSTEQRADGHVLRLNAEHAPGVIRRVEALADERGAEVLDLTVRAATLEDVFLSLTGQTLSEPADGEGGA